MATLAPRRASSRAVASPKPEAAPVTTAATPLMFMQVPLLALCAKRLCAEPHRTQGRDWTAVGTASRAVDYRFGLDGEFQHGLQEDRTRPRRIVYWPRLA